MTIGFRSEGGKDRFQKKEGATQKKTVHASESAGAKVPAAVVTPKPEEDSRRIVSSETMEKNGRYRVFFQVFDGKERIHGALLRITAQETNEALLTTDKNGEAGCTVIVCDKELVCLVTLVGTDVSICKNFFKL